MNRRGSAVLLVLVAIAAMLVLADLATSRAALDLHARPREDARVQALWLARTALDSGFVGIRTVDTAGGRAVVTAANGTARVELAGGVATVTARPYAERYDGGPR